MQRPRKQGFALNLTDAQVPGFAVPFPTSFSIISGSGTAMLRRTPVPARVGNFGGIHVGVFAIWSRWPSLMMSDR